MVDFCLMIFDVMHPMRTSLEIMLTNQNVIPFEELVERAAQGDPIAVESLLESYSGLIARELRTQRRFDSLKSLVDADDIAQSVWRCFFDALQHGDVSFQNSRDVAAYLATVTRNRIESQLRKHQADKRDVRRTLNAIEFEIAANEQPHPCHAISTLEFLQKVLRNMTSDERVVAKRRAAGATWEQLAVEMGTTAEALRKRHSRTAARLLTEFAADDGRS